MIIMDTVIMKDRIRLILLSPNLTSYLSELPENIWVC